jgi:hypothetical protein
VRDHVSFFVSFAFEDKQQAENDQYDRGEDK